MLEINLILIVDDGYGYLVKEKFDIVHGEDGATVVHVLFEVPLQVLEDEGEGLVGVDDVMQSH